MNRYTRAEQRPRDSLPRITSVKAPLVKVPRQRKSSVVSRHVGASPEPKNSIACIDELAHRVWVAKVTDDLADSTKMWRECPDVMPVLIKVHEIVWDFAIDLMNEAVGPHRCKVLKVNEVGDSIECVVISDAIGNGEPTLDVPIALIAWEFGTWVKQLLQLAFHYFELHFGIRAIFRIGINYGATQIIHIQTAPSIPYTVDTFQVGNETDYDFFNRGKAAEDGAPPNDWLQTREFQDRFERERELVLALAGSGRSIIDEQCLVNAINVYSVQEVIDFFKRRWSDVVNRSIEIVQRATKFAGFVGFIKVERSVGSGQRTLSKRCVLWEAIASNTGVTLGSWAERHSDLITIVSTQDNASSWNFVVAIGDRSPIDAWHRTMAAFKMLSDLVKVDDEGASGVTLKVSICYDDAITRLTSPDDVGRDEPQTCRLGRREPSGTGADPDASLFVRYICHGQNRAARIIYGAGLADGTIATDSDTLSVVPDAYFYRSWTYSSVELKSLGRRLMMTNLIDDLAEGRTFQQRALTIKSLKVNVRSGK